MNEDTRNGTIDDGSAAKRSDENRKTRSIRFSESEWEEVRSAALAHDLPASEFVRERILTLVRGSESAGAPVVSPSLEPPIERTFRFCYIVATKMRDEMIREGREEELEKLIAQARAVQETLGRKVSD